MAQGRQSWSFQLRRPIHNHADARARRTGGLAHEDPLSVARDVVVCPRVDEREDRVVHKSPGRADVDLLPDHRQLIRLNAGGRGPIDELLPVAGPAWVHAAAIRHLLPRRTGWKSLDEDLEPARL